MDIINITIIVRQSRILYAFVYIWLLHILNLITTILMGLGIYLKINYCSVQRDSQNRFFQF